MKKLLFQLDTDAIANTFDTVVGFDAGAHVIPHGGISPENVGKMVDGAVFTRSPKHKHNTALFVTGSDMAAGEAVFDTIAGRFFGDFRVSVMLDSNGSNTTAAAAVAVIRKELDLDGRRAVVLAGTGPVGQRAGVLLAREGASVVLTSRRLERAQAAASAMNERFGVEIEAAAAGTADDIDALLAGADIVIATGAAGVQLLAERQWRDHPTLKVLLDANATPPLGIEGVDMMDSARERHGKKVFGAIGFGGLKLEVQRACVERLFERNDLLLDVDAIYEVARRLA